MQRRNHMFTALTLIAAASALGSVGASDGSDAMTIYAPPSESPDVSVPVRKGKARAGAHASSAANKRRRNKRRRGWS